MRPDEDTDETWSRADLWHDLRRADDPCEAEGKACGCDDDSEGDSGDKAPDRVSRRAAAPHPRVPTRERPCHAPLDSRRASCGLSSAAEPIVIGFGCGAQQAPRYHPRARGQA